MVTGEVGERLLRKRVDTMMYYWGGHGWWMWGVMGVFGALVLALVVLAVIWLASSTRRGGPASQREDSPEDILKRRYARGEIDEEEYHRKLEELRR
jgi:putative membrane protein